MKSHFDFINEQLNFPPVSLVVEEDEAGNLSIFDSLRKKYLILTPEEWVRQHMIHFLIQYHEYPKSLFALEKGIKYNTLQKRFDILVLDRTGKPFLLIECKAPQISLSQKTMEQICMYNTEIKAPFIGITNGFKHLFLELNKNNMNYTQISSVPLI
jgi:hypothetical protein